MGFFFAAATQKTRPLERSLYERANGYSYDAVKIFMPTGAKKPVYAPYVEHVPPDVTACIFCLKNRTRLFSRLLVDPTIARKRGPPHDYPLSQARQPNLAPRRG